MKKKILFLIQLPGPIHGQSLINLSIKKSKKIKKKFSTHFINIALANSINDINLFKFKKLIRFISIIFKLIKSLIFLDQTKYI